MNGNYSFIGGDDSFGSNNALGVGEDSPEFYSSDSEVFIIENKNKPFYDIKIKTSSQKGEKILPEEVKILTFKNGKYEIIPPSK